MYLLANICLTHGHDSQGKTKQTALVLFYSSREHVRKLLRDRDRPRDIPASTVSFFFNHVFSIKMQVLTKFSQNGGNTPFIYSWLLHFRSVINQKPVQSCCREFHFWL